MSGKLLWRLCPLTLVCCFIPGVLGLGPSTATTPEPTFSAGGDAVADAMQYETTYLWPSSNAGGCVLYSQAILVSGFRTATCQAVGCRAVAPSFLGALTAVNGTTGDSFTFTFTDLNIGGNVSTAAAAGNNTANGTQNGTQNWTQNGTETSAGEQTWWWAYTACTLPFDPLPQGSLLISEFQMPGCPSVGDPAKPLYFTQYSKGCHSGPVSPSLNSYQAYCDAEEYFVVAYPDDACASASYTVLQHQDIGCFVYDGGHPDVTSIRNRCQSPSAPPSSGSGAAVQPVSLQIVVFAISAIIVTLGIAL